MFGEIVGSSWSNGYFFCCFHRISTSCQRAHQVCCENLVGQCLKLNKILSALNMSDERRLRAHLHSAAPLSERQFTVPTIRERTHRSHLVSSFRASSRSGIVTCPTGTHFPFTLYSISLLQTNAKHSLFTQPMPSAQRRENLEQAQ